MSTFIQNNLTLQLPTWVFWIGLFAIANFLAGCWFLLPPSDGSTVYFWLAQFYRYTLLPSLVFFLIGIIVVVFWFSRFIKKSLALAVVLLIGSIVAVLFFVPAFGTVSFVSTLRVIGRVYQNHHFYYLVKHYDDQAPTYSFCESDAIGFSGHCRYIGWKSDDSDPKIYIDQNTNLIMVESEKPSFTWRNSIPPSCINDPGKSNDKKISVYVGGCTP